MAFKRYKRNQRVDNRKFAWVNMPAAVLDANVLFPMLLRDTLLRVASEGCFRVHWSPRILEEMTRNLISDYGMEPSRAEAL